MFKWADYGVAAARFNAMDTDVVWLRCFKDNGASMEASALDCPRQEVVSAMKRGLQFVTIFWANDEWNIGNRVFLVNIHGVDYLRTGEDDSMVVDELEGLPRL